jgi:uncharacterized protein with von Willebrand factor type A (vWA) domain
MSSRRLRRQQERFLKNPKKIQQLLNTKPTEEEIDRYVQERILKAKLTGTRAMNGITPSDEMIEDLRKEKQEKMDKGYDKWVKEYYNIK